MSHIEHYKEKLFLWANPELSITLDLSTKSLQDFSIRFWVIAENKHRSKHNFRLIFVQQDSLQKWTPLWWVLRANAIASS